MESDYIVSKPYKVNPNNVKYDPRISSFNPPKGDKEYRGLLEQMRRSGQTTPAFIKEGLLGDGVHRTRACIELGIDLLAVDISPRIPDQEYILMCNENTFAARNDSPTQLAIKGLAMIDQFNFTDAEVIKLLGITDRRMIGYARTVRDSQYNKTHNVLDKLKAGKSVMIGSKHTKSLEIVKRLIAKIEEDAALAQVAEEVDKADVKLDYNTLIHTETAREKFWEFTKKSEVEQKLEYIRYLNYTYKIDKEDVDAEV